MTKVTMPKPMGYVSARLLREFIESSSEPGVDLHIEQLPFANRPPSGMNAVALITTDQAEAYKDACVREAMEKVIQNLDAESAKAREHKVYAAVLALMSQSELIRVQLHKQ